MNQQRCFILALIFLLFALFTHQQEFYNNGPSAYRNQTWMSTLDFGLSLREISILGTHNSVGRSNCFWLGSFQQCQANSLTVQLESGIRALDIRVKHDTDRFQAYDRSCDLGVNFDTILTEVRSFLLSYPSETVLMHVVQEQSSSGCTRSFQDTFKYYKDKYLNLMWTPTSQDPQLGQVRGKIVIIQQFNTVEIHGLLYATFTTLGNKKMGTNWDLYNKWMDVKNFMTNANTAKKSQISFWTGHGGSYPFFVASGKSLNGNNDGRLITGLTTPGFKSSYPDFPRVACFIGICSIVFEGVNILGYNHITNNNYAYTGIVYVDFYGDQLLQRILSRNTVIYSKCSLTKTQKGCTLCSFASVCLKCNTLLHYVYDTVTKTCLAEYGYYLDSVTFLPILCSTPMAGCLECSDGSTCLLCDQIAHYLLSGGKCTAEPGYYLDTLKIPVKCPQTGCAQCSDGIVCTVCESATNYIIDPATSITCMCDINQLFVQAPSTQTCICMITYFLSSNNTCQSMPKCPTTIGCLNCAPATNICLQCDNSNHFINDTSNTYCVCQPLYYFNGSTCELCNTLDAACDQCANQQLCLSCVDNFTLTAGVCQCSFMYYQVDIDTCQKCTVGCLKCTGLGLCTICDTANNFVLNAGYCECKVGMFNNNGTCEVCGAMTGCVDCNNAGCIACDAIFRFYLDIPTSTCLCPTGYFVNDMNICEQCMMQGCLQCTSQTVCTLCDTTLYFLNANDFCDDICGDGKLFYVECDDANLIDGDGCSSNCTVQNDFTCVDGTPTTPSVCSYSGPISLVIQKTLKKQTQNKVEIFMKIEPILLSFESLNFSNVVIPQFPIQTTTVIYDKNTGSILMTFTYNQSLNAKKSDQLQVQFLPPTGEPAYFYMQNSTVNLPMVSSNNLALKFYQPQIYQTFQMMKILTNVTAFIYLAVFLICFIFISKIIAIELIFIPQVTFAGLIMINKLESLLLPLKNLKYTNGYNPLFVDDVVLPANISILDYYGEFLSNFNIDLALIIVVLVVGGVLLLVGKIQDNKKIKKWAYNTFKQWTFCVLLIFQMQFTISFGIDFMYAPEIIGKVIGALLIVSLVVLMIFLFKKPSNFGQFKGFFVQQPKHLNFYILETIIKIIIGATLIFLSQNDACGFIAIGVLIINILYLMICQPYLNNLRQIINLIFLSGILGIQSFYKLNFYSEEATFITNYLPLVIVALLLVLLFINIVFILLHFKNKNKTEKINKYQLNDEQSFDQQMKKQYQKQLKVIQQIQIAISPSNLNKITERQMKYEEPLSSRKLLNKPSDLRHLKNMIRKQHKLQPLSKQKAQIYEQI